MGASLACAIQPGENIFEILDRLSQILRQPFSLHYTVYTGKCILILSFAYITGICIYYSQQKNYRRGVEHGSARWGDVHQICKRYADKEYTHNLLLTQNFRMSQEVYKHQRNLNVLVAGGSGAGKSRTYAFLIFFNALRLSRKRRWLFHCSNGSERRATPEDWRTAGTDGI